MKSLFATGAGLCLVTSALCLGLGITLLVKLPLHLPNGLLDIDLIISGAVLIMVAAAALFFSYLCFDLAR